MITGNSCSPGCKLSLPQTNRPPYFCVAMRWLPPSNTIISAALCGVRLLSQGLWGVSVVFKSRSCTHHWIPAAAWTDCHCCVQMTPNYNHLASNEIVLAWLHSNLIASAGSEEIKKKDHLRLFYSCRVWVLYPCCFVEFGRYRGCFISEHSNGIMSCDFITLVRFLFHLWPTQWPTGAVSCLLTRRYTLFY